MEVLMSNRIPVKCFLPISEIEDEAIQQIKNVTKVPSVIHVSIMPDVHAGCGATIGSVIASKDTISPSAVGVDIGCGMLAVPLHKSLNDFKLTEVYDKIINTIPVGFACHQHRKTSIGQVLRESASERVKTVWSKADSQIGTLGGGNHFIELCDDGTGMAWLMLHSGSRGIGNQIGTLHIKKAKELMKIWHISLDDPDLAYLVKESQEFRNYIEDLTWCQNYAFLNRQTMLDLILRELDITINPLEIVNCHHNYVSIENHFGRNLMVTRKGAVRAREGEFGIIPGSMGQKSYIVKGLGNKDSLCSCSHGAGRAMSRTKAKALFTAKDLENQTAGVICRKDDGVVDEIPSAYKNLDVVMENQKDLVSVEKTLKAVLCVKG